MDELAGCGCCATAGEKKSDPELRELHESEHGSNLDWALHIDTVAATSLGIEGWAPYDVGTLDGPEISSSTLSMTWAHQAHGIFDCRGDAGQGAVPLPLPLHGTE